MTAPPPVDLGPTLGVGYIGVGLCSMIYGAASIQAFQYYTSARGQSDGTFLRVFVGILWFLGTVRQALLMFTFYSFLVIHGLEGIGALLHNTWAIPASIVLTATITVLVDGYLILRIWRLSKRNVYVCIICGLCAIAHFVTAEVFSALQLANLDLGLVELEARYQPLGLASAASETATDTFIMLALSYYLYQSRSAVKRTNNLVNTLIVYTVTTGALCTCFSLASFVTYLTMPSAFYNYIFDVLGAELYINVLLTSLNVREAMRRNMDNKNTRGWDSIRLQSIAFTEPTLRGGERSGNDQSSTMISSSLVDVSKSAERADSSDQDMCV